MPENAQIAARGRGAAGGERKVERTAEVPAGEARRDERRGERPERRDVEALGFEPELGGSALPEPYWPESRRGARPGRLASSEVRTAPLADAGRTLPLAASAARSKRDF